MPRRSKREVLVQEAVEIAEAAVGAEMLNQLDFEASDGDMDSLSSTSSSSSSSSSGDDEDNEFSPFDDDEFSTPAMLLFLTEYLGILAENRVLVEKQVVDKTSQLPLVLGKYKESDPKRFNANLRCQPAVFDALLSKIEPHPIFTNRSPNPQMPVAHQLAICLYRFGHEGNAASIEGIAQWAGVSAGTVFNCTYRVMVATLALHDEAIRLPTDSEKEQAQDSVERESCREWRGGWCMVDGTLVPLFEKPLYFGEAYFDRKSNYSLNIMIINLPNLRIIDYVAGHAGSTHDATAFRDARIYKNKDQILGPNEWIWADSAFALDKNVIVPYKRPLSNNPENSEFNFALSQVRIRSEHCMGFLKGRFASLRCLRQQIRNPRAHKIAVAWIKTCLVLHMLMFNIEEGIDDSQIDEDRREFIEAGQVELEGEDHDDDGFEDPIEGGHLSPGKKRRIHLKTLIRHKLH